MSTQEKLYLFEKVKKSRVFNNIIKTFSLEKKAVLDVGCSEGHHLACFGPGSVGITIIDEHIEAGRNKGLTIVSKNVESPDFSMEKQFDVVWANNFFEHMNAPHTFLRKMSACVKEDGILILGVPVIPYLPFLSYVPKFRGAYAVSHVNFFYRKTLIETVKAAGWDVQEARLFYMKSPFLDFFFNLIAPHMYVVAKVNPNFKYAEKRLKSLRGYEDFNESD
jgi:2-polyprenyl-3-methyl-5-hydroxy-6-metoxy-1,4-benzoquinol methylase